jgi:hypothetical protein
MQGMPSWTLFAALAVVGAVLLLLVLKSRRSVTGQVRLNPAATHTPRSLRVRPSGGNRLAALPCSRAWASRSSSPR